MQDLERAKKLIEKRKKEAEKEYAEKLESLKKNEEFAEAYSRVSYLKFEFARCEVFKIPVDEELRKEYEEKTRFISAELRKVGIREDNLPNYGCPKCLDTGYNNGKCKCLEKARIEINLTDYKVLKTVPDDLDGIDKNFYKEESDNYAKRIEFLKQRFLNGDLEVCTVTGAPGTGKTFLADVVMKEFLLMGKSIKIINSVHLNREFLEYHCAPLTEKSVLWEEIVGYDCMLIDDLGVESVINNVTMQYLYELLTERIGKKTIITTNLSPIQLEDRYGQRIFSRLSDKRRSAIINVTGKDYRI